MGGINPVQLGGYGSPSASGGGILGFLANTLGGLHAANQQHREAQAADTENKTKQAQLKLDQQSSAFAAQKQPLELQQLQNTVQATTLANQGTQNTQDMSQFQALQSTLFMHPEMAKNPTTVATLKDLATKLHQPLDLNPDGSINIKGMTKPITEAPDQKTLQWYLQQDDAVKKPYLDGLRKQGIEVPDSLYKAGPAVGQVRNAFNHNAYFQAHTERADKTAASAQKARAKFYDTEGQLIPARVSEYYATAAAKTAEAKNAGLKAEAAITAANAAATRAAAYSQQVHNGRGSNSSQGAAILRSVTSAYDTNNRTVEQASQAYELAVAANPGDPSDPGVVAAGKQLADAQTALSNLATERDALYTSLSGGQLAANSVTDASGKLVTNTTNPKPGQVKVGTDGRTYQQQPSGKWKVIK